MYYYYLLLLSFFDSLFLCVAQWRGPHCWTSALLASSSPLLVFYGACLPFTEGERKRKTKKERNRGFHFSYSSFFQSTLFFFSIFHSLFFNINFIITYLLIQTKPTSVSSLILSWIHRSKCFQTTHFDLLCNFRDPLHLVSLLQLLLIYGSFH